MNDDLCCNGSVKIDLQTQEGLHVVTALLPVVAFRPLILIWENRAFQKCSDTVYREVSATVVTGFEC